MIRPDHRCPLDVATGSTAGDILGPSMNIQRFERWLGKQRNISKPVDGYVGFATKLAAVAGATAVTAAHVEAAIAKEKAAGASEMGLARYREIGEAILRFEREDVRAPDEVAPEGPKVKRKKVRRGG